MGKSHKRTALIIGASILGGGVVVGSTALITKAIVESQYNKNTYKVFFNGYKCHLSGDATVKKGSKYSAIIASEDTNYDPFVYSVTMGDKNIDYTFNNGHLIIDIPATGNITINAIATDRTKVYATGKFRKNESTGKYEVVGVDAEDLSSVTDLYIPDSITDPTTNESTEVNSIAYGALYGLSNLKNLTIPFIGSSKTKETTSLNKNLFGYIFGEKLFEGVRTLTWQYYDDQSTSDYLGAAIPSSLETVTVSYISKENQYGAFSNCANIKNIEILNCEKDTALSDTMFTGCSSLSKISYPSNVISIGNKCFYNCSSLVEADFTNNGITKIGDNAFDGCASLEKVKLPERITDIGTNAFANLSVAIILCEPSEQPQKWLDDTLSGTSSTPVMYGDLNPTSSQAGDFQYLKIKVPGNEETYEAYIVAYNGSNIGTIEIPATLDDIPVSYIGPRCFMELDRVTDVKIKSTTLKSIGSYAFMSCTSLKSINLNSCTSLKSLGTGCFYECNQLQVDDSSTPYFLYDSVENIGNYCFYDCYHILNINLKNVKSLGDYSFAYCCYNYTDPITGEVIFSDKDYKGNDACLKFVSLSTTLNKIGVGTFMNCRELKTISVSKGEGASIFDNIPDFCFYHTKIGSQVGFNVTETLETIGAYAFGYCTYLSKLDFSKATKVRKIGEGAFYNCVNISGDVTLPETLESIGAYAFEECVKLESLNIKSTDIVSVPFDFCFDCESLKSVSFAGSLTDIEDFAFGGCKSLAEFNGSTNPELSNSLYSLGNYAFSNCSSLKSIKLSASSLGLEKGLNIGSNVFAGWTSNQTIYLNKDLFDYYKKAKTVKTKFGWEMSNRTKIFGILTDNYSCEASGSSNVIITVE